MPSLSSLLNRPKRKPNGQDVNNGSCNTANEKLHRTESKRNFFRKILSKNSRQSESQASRNSMHSILQNPYPVNQASDTNKPLPPPPVPGTGDLEPTKKAPVKLGRIIEPLCLADIHKLFSGAPQFFVRSTGHHNGAPHPSVAFPWNVELEIRDLSDHGQIEDLAWGCVTAGQHIIRIPDRDRPRGVLAEKKKAHFRPRCFERPDMLSMQGLERGTMGFAATLETDVADALHEEPDDPASYPTHALHERRINFLNDKKNGLRLLDDNTVISKLTELSTSYHEDHLLHMRSTVEMYTNLFTQVLFPPTRVTDSDDPYSLHVQIEALVKVLATPGIWTDFSNVEWRIRLGQILWSSEYDPDLEDDPIANHENINEIGSQKSWLLLQIILSCELVIRLDTVTKNAERDPKLITASEIERFEKDVTRSAKWSVLLARIWLENIRVEKPKLDSPPEEKPPAGWLATLTGAEPTDLVVTRVHTIDDISFMGRNYQRQKSGLLHFARKLDWPHVDNIVTKFGPNHSPVTDSNESTPDVSTPLSMTSQRSYFGITSRPDLRRGLSKRKMSATMQPSGWLSKSYLSGLILPGEGLGHFLMSTLLENDETAIASLGEEANLYGGFIYSGKSFWSTACVVGRVLAAGKGASECMGWLSSGILPRGVRDGWINLDVDLPPHSDIANGPDAARIWKKLNVEKDSHVLGDGDASSILPGDFTLPLPDVKDPVKLDVKLESLELFAPIDSIQSTHSREEHTPISEAVQIRPIQTYSAMMQFTVLVVEGETLDINISLTYDVRFVTAHPCVPSPSIGLLDILSSPEFIVSQHSNSGRRPSGPHGTFAGHALHKSYKFIRHSLSSVLLSPNASTPQPLATLHTPSTEVFVIDCSEPTPPESATMEAHPISSAYISRRRRFGSDQEILARAWCAEKGYNALISRKGRNCIGCSIREARALGWKIVLRFG